MHLLMGENGAGKSTLMKIVAGHATPPMPARCSGDGQPMSLFERPPKRAHGIAMVHQECLLAQHLSVAENIFLGRRAARPARTR